MALVSFFRNPVLTMPKSGVASSRYRDEGKAVGLKGLTMKGNYDFLLCNDIDLDHPEVVTELNRWGKWVSKELNLDGMRLDAIKHMKDKFIAQFLDAVRSERGDKFYAVGEYWNGDLNTLDAYIKSVGHKVNLFDVPLHYNLIPSITRRQEL